jgi:4-hydroxybenzoate polyprenyltransferase
MTIPAETVSAIRVRSARSGLHQARLALTEARPVVQLMSCLRFLCGCAMTTGGLAGRVPVHIFLGLGAWECTVVCAYLCNGVMDIKEDRINGSSRPIARGQLSVGSARKMVAVAAILALLGGIGAGAMVAGLAIVSMILGYLYSGPPCHFKRSMACTFLMGNLIGLLSYGAGFFAAGGQRLSGVGLVCAVAFSLWTGLIGSATKDLSDVPGDAMAGRRTAAVRFGEGPVRRAAALLALALATAFLAVAAAVAPRAELPATAMLGGAVLVTMVCLGRSRPARRPGRLLPTPERPRREPYRAFMLTQYAAHLCMLGSAAGFYLTR